MNQGRSPAVQEVKQQCECGDGGFQTRVQYVCQKIGCPTNHTSVKSLAYP